MNYFDCGGGVYVNLLRVEMITQRYIKAEKAVVTKFFIRDECISETARDFPVTQYVAPVVPAAPGTYAIRVWCQSEEVFPATGRPVTTEVCRVPIVAWQVVHDGGLYANPVLLQNEDGDRLWYPQPDGTFLKPEDCTVDSLEEVVAVELSYAQSEWDQAQEAKKVRADAGLNQ